MKKHKLLSLFLIAGALVGCANSSSSTPSVNGSDNGEATITPDAEKVLNVYMPSPATLHTTLANGFYAATGIQVNVTSGTTGELMAKIEAEGAGYCDVLITASWSEGLASKDNDKIKALKYTPKNANKLYSSFKEDSGEIWGTSASAVGIIYNTTKVSKETIEALDWKDFGDSSKWNLSMNLPDPTLSGASKDFIAGFVTRNNDDENNMKIIDSWVANGLKNGGKNGPALKAVKAGTVAAVIGGVDYNCYSDMKKGEKIDIYYPKSGTVINPRPAMILGAAKHVNNAKLFMDYLLSDEAQGLVANEYLLPGRSDYSALQDRTQVSDITSFTGLDWNKMANQGSTLAQSVVDKIKTAGN